MARPKSMSDFTSLFDATYTPLSSVPERERRRRSFKKPSISLAAGLIMASETHSPVLAPQLQQTRSHGDGSEGLFYAYAQKSDYAQSPPYTLTFASATVANQWWNLVKQEYPDSERIGPQLFILKGDDMQEQIQDNPRFFGLQNRWFYTASDGAGGQTGGQTGVIPLQDYSGRPLGTAPAPEPKQEEQKVATGVDMTALNASLDKMNSMIAENSAQIRALSVAQSEGLQRMQEINESNTLQIKALADGQAKLQSLMDQNASHYIALSNATFSNQEQVKHVLQTNAEQIRALANGQSVLTSTCKGMMHSIEAVGQTVSRVGESLNQLSVGSDVGSNGSVAPPVGSILNHISPSPRKLNRKVKGVWYEYDMSPTQSPRRTVTFLDTPPKSPTKTRT